MRNGNIALGLVTALLMHSLSGCGGTNLTGYRPASEHDVVVPQESTDAPKSVADSNQKLMPGEDEPLEGTVEEELELLPVSALVPVNVVSSVRALMSIPAGETKPAEATAASPADSNLIRVTDSAGDKPAASAGDAKPNPIELLIKDKKFQTESKTGALRVSFDDLDLLKVLNMDPVVVDADELMPDWLKGLNGKPIRIRGFMYPTYETEGIERFVLARDNQICCFGRDPKIYDLVQVDMKAGKTTNYIPATRAFDVVGTFRIKMMAEDGKPYGLYQIEQATVIDR